MMAARDTTASLIASLLYELSKHPDVQTRLRAEVKERLGDDMRLSFEDVKHLKLLRAVINETLR
jgi:cytochrome P450